ncbi:MAG: lipopolysaccharide biosynthesis protein, partial [Enterococcus sp.]
LVNIGSSIFLLIVLVTTQNFFLFLLVKLIATIIGNLAISRKVSAMYPAVNWSTKEKIREADSKRLINNTKEMIGARVGAIVLDGTDNIVISSFLGITFAGIYANYVLIVFGVSLIISRVINAVTASLGNLSVSSVSEKSREVLETYFFICFIITLYCSTLLFNLFNPFIEVWIGETFLLNWLTVYIIVINFIFRQMRAPMQTYINAYGTFKFQGVISLIGAIMNLGLSIFFINVFHLGIAGVVFATILTTLLVDSWWEARKVYVVIFKEKLFKSYIQYLLHVVFIGLVALLNNLIVQNLLENNFYFIINFILIALITVIVDTLIIVIVFYRTPRFKKVVGIFMKLAERFLSRG